MPPPTHLATSREDAFFFVVVVTLFFLFTMDDTLGKCRHRCAYTCLNVLTIWVIFYGNLERFGVIVCGLRLETS